MQFAIDFLPTQTVLRAYEGALKIVIPFGSQAPALENSADEQSLICAVSRDDKGTWQLSQENSGTVMIVLYDANNQLPSRLDSYRNALAHTFSNGDISSSDLAQAAQDFTLNGLTPELFATTVALVLSRFAFVSANTDSAEASTTAAKPKGKAQHRFRKELSAIAFYVDDFGAKATIYWQKRNEMRILAGAQLRRDIPLRKDGEQGMNARFGNTLRDENADKIKDFVTTDDIVVRSVNEAGLLLYYGDTNSWLVLRDVNGKTIDEYSRV